MVRGVVWGVRPQSSVRSILFATKGSLPLCAPEGYEPGAAAAVAGL